MEKKSIKQENLKVVGGTQSGEKKLTYEQLEQVANSLNNRCRDLYNSLQEAQKVISSFNEIGMLLSIIEHGGHFNYEFVERCSKKIQDVVSGMLDDADKVEKSDNVESK